MNKPIIELKSYQFTHISRMKESAKENSEHSVTFNVIGDDSLEVAILRLKLDLNFKEYKINVEVEGYFQINDSSMDFEKIKSALSINGTAILYPYLRSAVSILTSIDSEESLLLPTINTHIFEE